MRFVDLFAGLGGFRYALEALDHECVFTSEIDPELASLYKQNFVASNVYGDIRLSKDKIPQHDILCGGFPCQPFSKSGSQLGSADVTRGTLFHEILDVIRMHEPRYIILENVGNFERHDNGRTWKIARRELELLEYDVRGTVHVGSGGHGLISPHHFGFPHHRERFFIVASKERLPIDPFPVGDRKRKTSLLGIVEHNKDLSKVDKEETQLSAQQRNCINHWNEFLQRIPKGVDLPSFPIWSDEFDAAYPFESTTPYNTPVNVLKRTLGVTTPSVTHEELLDLLPAYARDPVDAFPAWKVRFIQQNRNWYSRNKRHILQGWLEGLADYPASLRKFEWNCNGEERDLWRYVLQFRPSGLRAKRYTSIPALVAMTVTQIPILGPKGRFLTRTEGLRLQGFPDNHVLPSARASAFAALGNAVHVGVVRLVASWLLAGRGGFAPSQLTMTL